MPTVVFTVLHLTAGLLSALLALEGGPAAGERRRAAESIEAGIAALRAGDALGAVERLREALQLDPGSGEARLHLGDACRRLGLREQARAEYEAGLKAGGPRVELLQNLGVVEAEAGRFQRAAQHFESAVRIAPGRSDLRHNLGKAYQELARFKEAAGAFEEALRLNPADQESAAALGQLLIMEGRPGRAIEVLSAALNGRPDHAEACYRMGVALFKEHKMEQAAASLERAVRADPDHAGAWLKLAEASHAVGNEGRSREARARFQELYHQDRRAETEANRRAREIDRGVPGHYARGQQLAAENRWAEAIREFDKILALQPDDAPTLVNIGRLYAAQGDRPRAREFLEKAIRAEPGRVDPYIDMARLERGAGRPDQALQRAEQALALSPSAGEAWLVKGILHAEAEGWAASAAALEEAARLLPGSPEPDAWLAGVYAKLGRAADAQRARGRARARSGGRP